MFKGRHESQVYCLSCDWLVSCDQKEHKPGCNNRLSPVDMSMSVSLSHDPWKILEVVGPGLSSGIFPESQALCCQLSKCFPGISGPGSLPLPLMVDMLNFQATQLNKHSLSFVLGKH